MILDQVVSQYLSLECIKSTIEKLEYIFFENSNFDIMYMLKYTKDFKDRTISFPVYCRLYKGKVSLKQFAFDEAISRIKRVTNTTKDFNDAVKKIYNNCFV